MNAKANIEMGGVKYLFEVEEKDPMDTLHQIIALSNPRRFCNNKTDNGVCGAKRADMYFTTNKDKEGNTYVNVKCNKCGARSKLGKYKSGGFFWHDFEVYTKEEAISDDLDGQLPANPASPK